MTGTADSTPIRTPDQRLRVFVSSTLAEAADRPLRMAASTEWADRIETDAGNLAAAVRWYLDQDLEPLPHLFRVLWGFWVGRDHLREGRVGLRAWPLQRAAEAAMAEQLRSVLGASRFHEIFSVGSGLNRYEAVAAARDRH